MMQKSPYKNMVKSCASLWYLIKPLVLFYAGFYVTYFLFISIIAANGVTNVPQWMNAIANGICMLGGILALFREITQERWFHGKAEPEKRAQKLPAYLGMLVLAVSSAILLNKIITLTGLMETSQSYQDAADLLYAAPFTIGLLLYGVVSPLTEEVLFRFLLYNRLKRFKGKVWFGVIASSLLFAVFHGNLVQAIYSFILGAMMAMTYEYFDTLIAPFLFHSIANLVVYVSSTKMAVYDVLFSAVNCVILTVILTFMLGYMAKKGILQYIFSKKSEQIED